MVSGTHLCLYLQSCYLKCLYLSSNVVFLKLGCTDISLAFIGCPSLGNNALEPTAFLCDLLHGVAEPKERAREKCGDCKRVAPVVREARGEAI